MTFCSVLLYYSFIMLNFVGVLKDIVKKSFGMKAFSYINRGWEDVQLIFFMFPQIAGLLSGVRNHSFVCQPVCHNATSKSLQLPFL